MNDRLKPLPAYPGRKGGSGTWQQIVSQIPKCKVFIDAMSGSGFISSKVSGCKVVVNDIDRCIIDKISFAAADIIFISGCYAKVINDYGGSRDAVFYFDPPYLHETRSYKADIYKYDWTLNDHLHFLGVVVNMESRVMISHYPCERYNEALKGWRYIDYNTMTRAGLRVERLYMNFPEPVLLQCPGYVGKNFTDRQRINRKVSSFVSKLNRYPANERAAILTSIIDHFNYVIS